MAKPEKGACCHGGYGEMMGGSMMSRMMGGDGGMGGMAGFGGMAGQMESYAKPDGQMQRQGWWDGWGWRNGWKGAEKERKGTDKRNVDTRGRREKKEKAAMKAKGPTLFDPYFDIVQVTVYGQARFFNPPPAEPGGRAQSGSDGAPAAGAATRIPGRLAQPQAAPARARREPLLQPARSRAGPRLRRAPPKLPRPKMTAQTAKTAPKTGDDQAPKDGDAARPAKTEDDARLQRERSTPGPRKSCSQVIEACPTPRV